jgi:hypothetical protein
MLLGSLIEGKGYRISVYSYDGYMIYGDHYDNEEFLVYINDEINKEIDFKYKVRIIFKRP